MMLIMLLLTSGCAETTNDQRTRSVETGTGKDTAFTYNVYQSDSIAIDVKNDSFRFTVMLTIGDFQQQYDLTQLHIPATTPDEIKWVNDAYACMMTYWSQAESRYIFIPVKRTKELIYIDRNILETDSINNNVVYVDTVLLNTGKMVFKVENLLTRKTKQLILKIDGKNELYPYYEKIILTGSELMIKTSREQKSIGLRDINAGPGIL